MPIGLGNLLVVAEGELGRARVLALTSVAYGLLQLGAVARFGDQVQWQEAGAWLWLALLVSAIVTGGYVVAATAERRPATMR